MTIDKKTDGNNVELFLSGWMDTQNAPMLASAISELDDTTEHLLLDMTSLEYTSSAGIRQIVAAHKRMNGRLTLKNVSPEIMEVLKMTGLDKKLNIEVKEVS